MTQSWCARVKRHPLARWSMSMAASRSTGLLGIAACGVSKGCNLPGPGCPSPRMPMQWDSWASKESPAPLREKPRCETWQRHPLANAFLGSAATRPAAITLPLTISTSAQHLLEPPYSTRAVEPRCMIRAIAQLHYMRGPNTRTAWLISMRHWNSRISCATIGLHTLTNSNTPHELPALVEAGGPHHTNTGLPSNACACLASMRNCGWLAIGRSARTAAPVDRGARIHRGHTPQTEGHHPCPEQPVPTWRRVLNGVHVSAGRPCRNDPWICFSRSLKMSALLASWLLICLTALSSPICYVLLCCPNEAVAKKGCILCCDGCGNWCCRLCWSVCGCWVCQWFLAALVSAVFVSVVGVIAVAAASRSC